jgi:hypothetical protein
MWLAAAIAVSSSVGLHADDVTVPTSGVGQTFASAPAQGPAPAAHVCLLCLLFASGFTVAASGAAGAALVVTRRRPGRLALHPSRAVWAASSGRSPPSAR